MPMPMPITKVEEQCTTIVCMGSGKSDVDFYKNDPPDSFRWQPENVPQLEYEYLPLFHSFEDIDLPPKEEEFEYDPKMFFKQSPVNKLKRKASVGVLHANGVDITCPGPCLKKMKLSK